MVVRFSSIGLITALLFAVPTYGQLFSWEQLKTLEDDVSVIKSDTTTVSSYQLETTDSLDLAVVKTFNVVDSLLVFIDLKKNDPSSVFEADIIPFIENECRKSGIQTFDFSEGEDQIFDSFLKVFKWEKVIETVGLYETLVLNNRNEKERCESFLTVVFFIKHLYWYINGKKEIPNSTIYKCFSQNFESNNEVDWRVFALNPGKLIFWTMAT